MKDWCHTHNIFQENSWGCVGVQVICHKLMTSRGEKRRPNFEIAITQLLSYSVETSTVIICGTWDIFMIHSDFGVGLKDRQRSKIETVSRNFQNQCSVHDSFNQTSRMNTAWEIVYNETNLTTITSSVTSKCDFEYCPLFSCLGQGDSRRKFYDKYLGMASEYRNDISGLHMTKDDR